MMTKKSFSDQTSDKYMHCSLYGLKYSEKQKKIIFSETLEWHIREAQIVCFTRFVPCLFILQPQILSVANRHPAF